MKAFAYSNLNIAKMKISQFDKVEHCWGKEQNAGYQHFLLFRQCFPKSSSQGLKIRDCVVTIERSRVRFRDLTLHECNLPGNITFVMT